jgi:hypothetical protein
MKKAFALLNTALFIEALRETVAMFAYVKTQGDYRNSFDLENVTYGSLPVPTSEQQTGIYDFSELLVLCFVSNCIFAESVAEIDQLLDPLEECRGFKIRKELLNSLRGNGSSTDYNCSLAVLLFHHRCAIDKKETLSPKQIFELAFKVLQIAKQINKFTIIAKPAFEWLSAKWLFIWNHQRFLLTRPTFYEKSITQVSLSIGDSWIDKIIYLLIAILPTMGLRNESQLIHILNDMLKKES